ncbi:Phosphate regulon transcriptional regulatory protein PhoB (SphR) [hydrothermal vent metagenome]|uniref:Phosphate regulon transcriptional regulatory protein PhoB (SphR) n=1 Tax=hydrothermal vent metagenome TaxID=652676 RepID=A0A3B0Z6V2_9ZZZZ
MSDHHCDHFSSGEAFLDGVDGDSHDLFILDWELPGISGIEVLKHIRCEWYCKIPVLFTTTRDDKEDIVMALELGADDYMVKPVDHKEMLARISAMVRRYSSSSIEEQPSVFGEYTVDIRERKILNRGVEVELTAKEFDLAVCFFNDMGHILTRESLLGLVWGINADITTRTIDTHVSRLRKKLGLIPENGWHLESIYHHGYRLIRRVASDQ